MHDMYELNELKERVMEELIEFGRKGSFSRNELPTIDLLAHTAKNLCKVIEMCEEKTGYSYGMRTNMRGNYNYSGERRRDSMGRYSADDDWMMETLHELKDKAPNDKMRMEFDEFISRMERTK